MKKIFLRIFNPPSKGNAMEDTDKIINDLIMQGALDIAGIDHNGDILYSIKPTLKEVMPDLYNQHLQDVNAEIMNLWEKGFLDIDMLSNDPIVKLTDKSFSSKELRRLSSQELWSLEEIKRVLATKN